jgi:hypothetical protein
MEMVRVFHIDMASLKLPTLGRKVKDELWGAWYRAGPGKTLAEA